MHLRGRKFVKHIVVLASIAVVTIVLAACQPNTVGVFFSLENTVKIDEEARGVNKAAAIKSFVAVGQHYYLTTSTLQIRAIGANQSTDNGYTWKAVEPPNTATDITYINALKVDSDGNDLIAHFSYDSTDGLATDLFRSRGEITYAQADNARALWTKISPASLSAEQRVSNFFVVEGTVIAEIQTRANLAYSYQLHNVNNNNNIGVAEPLPFVDVAYDNSMYWFISVDKIFQSADISTTTLTAVDTSVSPFVNDSDAPLRAFDNAASLRIFNFSALTADSANTLYLSTKSGYIFTHAGGGNWNVLKNNGSTAQRFEKTANIKTIFTDILVVPAAFSGSEQVLIASQNEGYSAITSDTITYFDPATQQATTNLFSTSLYKGHITGLYYLPGSSENALFVLTPQNSLWRGFYADSYLTWKKEL